MFPDVFDSFWALWTPIWAFGHALSPTRDQEVVFCKLVVKPFSHPIQHNVKGCQLGLPLFLVRVRVRVRVRGSWQKYA